jgi:hypothetical protein
MDAAVLAGRAGRDGHIDPHAAGAYEPMQRGGRSVREDRPGPACQDGGHPETVACEQTRRHERIDAVVDAVQTAGRRALADSRRCQAEIAELSEVEDEMLDASQSSQCHVKRSLVEKRNWWLRISTRLCHHPILPRKT